MANSIGQWDPENQTVSYLLSVIKLLHSLTYSEKSCIKISVPPQDPAQAYVDRVAKLSKKCDIRACDYNGDCIVRVRKKGYSEWIIKSIQELEE